jgi:putative transposase
MIDGVFVGGENCIVIALGIDADGRKQMLDFEAGTSESAETVTRLLNRLRKRGVSSGEGRRLLVVRDGSEAIKSAVRRLWPEALQQTCLVHLEREHLGSTPAARPIRKPASLQLPAQGGRRRGR